MTMVLASLFDQRLVRLAPVDMVIVAFYFVLVLAIGFYLKERANTGEDFFMAGREMTAWVAGLSFLSANLGALELMGWAAAAYQYGILATHWYWIGAIPAMLFLGLVMMPFYYISKTHSVPGYLKLRFGEPSRALAAVSFAFMTVLMSGINMYAMALVMQVVLGWDIHFSIWVSALTVGIYVSLGGLRSAIFNEVLQFILIWAGALLIPILGFIEVGGWSNLKAQIARNASSEYTHLWGNLGSFSDNPMGIHWTGIVLGLGFVISFGYWTTDFLVVQRVLAAKDLRSAKMAPHHRRSVQDDGALHRDPSRLAWASRYLPMKLTGAEVAAATGGHSYNEVLPLMLARYCGPGLLGLGITALIAGFMSGMAGNVSAFSTVWTYDIYRALIKKDASDAHYVTHGPVVHDFGRADQYRHGVPGDGFQEHHGLRPGALQFFHRAAIRHGHSRHVVEAGESRGWILGFARGNCFFGGHVGLGENRPISAGLRRALESRARHGGKYVPRALVVDCLRSRDGRGQLAHQTQAFL